MTPIDAVLREMTLELEALRNRIGNGQMPETITLRVELDRQSKMPRAVVIVPEWRRVVLGGAVSARRVS